jgi:hypothetical protein
MWEVINARSASLTTPATDFKIQIRDGYATEDFFTSAVWASLHVGNGEKPFYLPRPYIFRGGTTITVTCTDNATGQTDAEIQVVLIGYKTRMTS